MCRLRNAFVALSGLVVVAFAVTPSHAQSEVSQKQFLAAVQGSPAWEACQRYYEQVDALSVLRKPYDIRDVSIAFVKSAPSITLRTEQERFLLVECINLANGNATFSHEEIGTLESADDKFFDNLIVDTVNNSNAAQHDYVGEMKGKYHLDAEVEAGKAEFHNRLEEGRAAAMQKVLIGAAVVGSVIVSASGASQFADVSGYNNFGSTYSGGNFNGLISTFQHLANALSQTYTAAPTQTASSGGPYTAPAQTASTGGNLPYTPAPSQPPSGSAVTTNVPEEGKLVSAPAPTPQPKPEDNKAILADAACVDLKADGSDGALVKVSNVCKAPVEFHWCWLRAGQQDCQPEHLSGIIPSGESKLVHGPGIGEALRPRYVVCDMSEKDKFCTF